MGTLRTVAVVLPPNTPATVLVDDVQPPGPHTVTLPASGYAELQLSTLPVTRVVVTADGYQPYAQEGVQIPPSGGFQFRIGVPADPARPQDVLLPALVPLAPPVPYLKQEGSQFVDAQGNRVVYPGIDGFDDVWLASEGRVDQLDDLLQESQHYGFGVRRIWCMGDAGQNQVFSLYPQRIPDYFNLLRTLVATENRYGQIPLFTAFVDAQVVMPDGQDRVRFWSDLDHALRGSGSYLISAWNQASKNGGREGVGPADLPALAPGVIWSRGSDVDDTYLSPNGAGGPASASELHATRTSFDRALMDTTASPAFMRAHGSGMIWMTEEEPFGLTNARGYTEAQAEALGRAYSIRDLWALAVFHNRESQRGLLMTDDTARKAAAWVRGMQP